MTMPDRVRSSMRIVAFDGPAQLRDQAMRRMTGRGDPMMHAEILGIASQGAGSGTLRHLSDDDQVTLLLGAVEAYAATAKVKDGDRVWRRKQAEVMQEAHRAGCSLRDIAAAPACHTPRCPTESPSSTRACHDTR